jgi:hypothetical protein
VLDVVQIMQKPTHLRRIYLFKINFNMIGEFYVNLRIIVLWLLKYDKLYCGGYVPNVERSIYFGAIPFSETGLFVY